MVNQDTMKMKLLLGLVLISRQVKLVVFKELDILVSCECNELGDYDFVLIFNSIITLIDTFIYFIIL